MFSRPSECCFQPILTPWCTSSQKQVTHLLLLHTQTPADSWQMHPWPVSISRTQSSHLNNLSTVTAHTYEDKCIHTLARSTQRTTPHHTYQSHRVASITDKCGTGIDRVMKDPSCCDLWDYYLFDQPDGQSERLSILKRRKNATTGIFKKHLALQRSISKEKSPISNISNMLVWYSMNERGISLLIIHVCVYVWKCARAVLSGCFLCMWAVWLSTKINFLWEAPATGQNHSIAPLFSCV